MQMINCDKAPAAIGPYSHATVTGNLVFTSGQLPSKIEGDIKVQAKSALENLKSILETAGTDLSHVVKTTCFLADISDFADFNSVYQEFFQNTKPARSCFQVAALPKGALIEIEAIAEK